MPKRSLALLVALALASPYEGDSTKHARSVRPDVFKYGFWLPRDSTRYQGEAMPEQRAEADLRFGVRVLGL